MMGIDPLGGTGFSLRLSFAKMTNSHYKPGLPTAKPNVE